MLALLAFGVLAPGCGLRMFLQLTEIPWAKDVRVFLGAGGNSAALLHGTEALLVDPKFNGGSNTVRHTLETELQHKVQRIVITHSHIDHAGGLDVFPDVGVVIAHPNTRARLVASENNRLRDQRVSWADVDQEIHLVLEQEDVIIRYLGVGHTDGDLVVLFPKHKLLMTGDLYLKDTEPHVSEQEGGNILALVSNLERMMTLDFETVLPGHGELATRADLARYRDYLVALEKETRAAIAAGKGEDQAADTVLADAFPDIQWMFPLEKRSTNVRKMYRAVQAARAVTALETGTP